MRIRLNDKEKRYCIELIRLIRDATQRASAASAQWNKVNDEFNGWYRRQFSSQMATSPVNGEFTPEDPVHYVGIKQKNLALNDAEATWSHWEREVRRLAAALSAEVQIRQLMGLTDTATEAPDLSQEGAVSGATRVPAQRA